MTTTTRQQIGRNEVVQAARDGEDWALTELFRVYQPQLLRYLRRSAPGAADDLAAEVWVGVTRGLHRFIGDEAAFRSWLFTIARCRLVEHWRTAARSRTEPMADGLLDDHTTETHPEDPALVVVEELSSREAVARATEGLTAEQAAIVRLRVVEGRDVAEVARILRRSPGSVRVMCMRTLRRLATRFPKGAAVVLGTACLAAAATGAATTRTVARWLADPPPAQAPAVPSPTTGDPGPWDGPGGGEPFDHDHDHPASTCSGGASCADPETSKSDAAPEPAPATRSTDAPDSPGASDDREAPPQDGPVESPPTNEPPMTTTTASPSTGPPLPPQAQGQPPEGTPGPGGATPPRASRADDRAPDPPQVPDRTTAPRPGTHTPS